MHVGITMCMACHMVDFSVVGACVTPDNASPRCLTFHCQGGPPVRMPLSGWCRHGPSHVQWKARTNMACVKRVKAMGRLSQQLNSSRPIAGGCNLFSCMGKQGSHLKIPGTIAFRVWTCATADGVALLSGYVQVLDMPCINPMISAPSTPFSVVCDVSNHI